MRRLALRVLPLAGLLVACGPAHPQVSLPPTSTTAPRTLTVFAAASLTEAFTEIGRDFEASHPGVTVAFNFAGSQILVMQITQGAAVDVFASASDTYMDKLVSTGVVQAGAPEEFLTNLLIVILPRNNPANIQTLQDLARPGLKLVLGDVSVPAGNYARQILGTMSQDPSFGATFKTKVLANVVSNETDVKQVVAKVQLGEADAGIVYVSDWIAAPQLKTIAIPARFNVIARYPIAPLIKAPQPKLASEFIAYVLSPDGQAVLKKWGFTPVAP